MRCSSPIASQRDLWSVFEPFVVPMLSEEDDAELWAAVVNAVYPDAELLCHAVRSGDPVFTQLGRCSHWLRPNQSRWIADGGFAWPSGYGGTSFSLMGLPEYDWCAQWEWSPVTEQWPLRQLNGNRDNYRSEWPFPHDRADIRKRP